MTTESVLLARGLAAARGRRVVVRDLDVVLAAGTRTRVVGVNGSGKTTLLRVLAGVAVPRGGEMERHGACAFVPERVALPAGVDARRWCGAVRRLRGLGSDGAPAWPAGTLSKGQLQRAVLEEALESGAALLVLDEPAAGLDGAARAWLARALADNPAAVVWTEHPEAPLALQADQEIAL